MDIEPTHWQIVRTHCIGTGGSRVCSLLVVDAHSKTMVTGHHAHDQYYGQADHGVATSRNMAGAALKTFVVLASGISGPMLERRDDAEVSKPMGRENLHSRHQLS
jgi:hypothetical protein